jgi:hypothetical protein
MENQRALENAGLRFRSATEKKEKLYVRGGPDRKASGPRSPGFERMLLEPRRADVYNPGVLPPAPIDR